MFYLIYVLTWKLFDKQKAKKLFCKGENKQAVSSDPSLPGLDFMAQEGKT